MRTLYIKGNDAGQRLDKFLFAVDIDREKVYIANSLKCRPPKNRDPLPAEEDEAPQYAEVYEDAESVYEDADQTSAAADDATEREDPTEAGDMPADEVADESLSDELALPENEPADDISVEESDGEEMPIISDSTMEKALERMIDKMISKEDENDDEQYLVLNVNGAPCIIKKKASSDKSRDFAYADSNEGAAAAEGAVVIPYTREQYLAMPRKRKKNLIKYTKQRSIIIALQ